jgi:tetratricopeptide (TPR) repeat protein
VTSPRPASALVACALTAAACGHVEPPRAAAAPPALAGVEARIARDRQRVTASPRLYPAWVELARDELDAARATHDPRRLAEARAAAQQSLAIQDTFEAYRVMVEIQNYSHLFEDAIRWAWLAADASTNGRAIMDPWIVSELVEADLGLGRLDDAQKLLPPLDEDPQYFYYAAAEAQWLTAAGRHAEAARRFLRAADLARAEKAPPLATWATVAAAGALLDGHDAAGARPLFERAAREGPPSAALRVHQAELAMAVGRPGDALARYEEALADDADPEVERMAFTAAKRAGDDARARAHFAAAERGFDLAVAAGEVYTLGALAQLYADAGVHLDRARALSERNWKVKRDGAARATWIALHDGAAPPAPPSSAPPP